MLVQNALGTFQHFAATKNIPLESLSPLQAIDLMTAFYADIRAEECDLNADGDMLLFQWGTYGWGTGEHFSYNITRQFIVPIPDESEDESEVEDSLWQLSLTIKYHPHPSLTTISSGNRWCTHPDMLSNFIQFIMACEATKQVQRFTPNATELRFNDVE